MVISAKHSEKFSGPNLNDRSVLTMELLELLDEGFQAGITSLSGPPGEVGGLGPDLSLRDPNLADVQKF